MEQTKTPWHAKLALVLALLLPAYFAVAALGTKFGLWPWQTGLGTLIGQFGVYVLGAVAVISLISLIAVLLRKPRKGWLWALIGLAVPVGIFVMLGSVRETAGANPIHDVSTDIANPPQFTEATMAARNDFGANPVSDYSVPLNQIEWWSERGSDELKSQSTGEIVGELYPDLEPLPLGMTDVDVAMEKVTKAMTDIGLTDVKTTKTEDGFIAEGVAETFWFGFKDDVIARIADGEIDFRSVSRVGVSDLGANAARLRELRAATEKRLSE